MLAIVGNENTSNTELGESCSVVQNEEDSAITNLTEDDSVIQKEEESRSFNRELAKQLSTRTLFQELLEANKIITDKDSMIERLRKENEELVKQHNITSHQAQSIDIQQQTQLEFESELSKKDALIKELEFNINRLEQQLQKNNDRNEKSVVPYGSNDVYDNPTIDFELSLPFEDVQNHIKSLYNENKGLGILSIIQW
jgi:hypothetical protein